MLTRRALLLTPAITCLRAQTEKPKMFGNAESYERFMGRWSRLLAPPLIDFTTLPDSGRILDVGSGTGSLAFAIAERKPRTTVVGIDPSREYVAYATHANHFPDRVSFQEGDAQKLSFPDRSFDGAASLLVFNFIPDANKAIAEVRRVTKPGGKIGAAVWDYGDRMRMLRILWDAVIALDPKAERGDEAHMRLCHAGELGALWKQAGLKDVHEEPIEITMQFRSLADYWDPFLLGQGPAGAYVTNLDRAGREALRSEIKRRLKLASDDQPFSLPARVWAVRGTVG